MASRSSHTPFPPSPLPPTLPPGCLSLGSCLSLSFPSTHPPPALPSSPCPSFRSPSSSLLSLPTAASCPSDPRPCPHTASQFSAIFLTSPGISLIDRQRS